MKTSEQLYIKVKTVNEALDNLKRFDRRARIIAGGTDVMVNRQQGNETSEVLIDICGIPELCKVKLDQDFISLGALVTLEQIAGHEELRKLTPALCEAARSVGTPLIRTTATVGGNILCENRCLYYNQSEWWREAAGYCLKCDGDICIATGGPNACFSELVSDTVPVLVSMEAKVRYAMISGEVKTVLLRDIYTGNGVSPRAITNSDLITEILIPANKKYRCIFNKLRLRESLDFTSLSTAVCVDDQGTVRIALAGVDPKPVYLETGSGESVSDVCKKLLKSARSVDNDVFTRAYRREMIKEFIEKSYNQLQIL